MKKPHACQFGLTMACQAKFTALLLACLVAGCAPLPVSPDNAHPVRVEHGRLESRTGCVLDYSRYHTAQTTGDSLVVVGHGFLRSRQRMDGLARALAASGLPTVTLDFCRARSWRPGHVRNGFDMIRVADALHAGRVVYVGFSAGGLAALVAARNDPRARGAVTLDLVDADAVGRHAAAGFDRPLIGLVGEPSACNARGNGLAVLAAARLARIERIAGADHCDFESPTDRVCRLLCGSDRRSQSESDRIIHATVTAVRSLTGDAAPAVSLRCRGSPDPGG